MEQLPQREEGQDSPLHRRGWASASLATSESWLHPLSVLPTEVEQMMGEIVLRVIAWRRRRKGTGPDRRRRGLFFRGHRPQDHRRAVLRDAAGRGTATIIGMIPKGTKIEIDASSFLRRERKIQGSSMGSNRFRTDMHSSQSRQE